MELFHDLGDGETVNFRKLRYTFGTEVELGDHELELYYRIDDPQDNPFEATEHILGLGYQISFD